MLVKVLRLGCVVTDNELDVIPLYSSDEVVRGVHHETLFSSVKDHVVLLTTIDSSSCYGNHRERVLGILANLSDFVSKVPVVHTEVSSPCRDEVGFVDDHESDTSLTDEVTDIV